MKNHTIPVYALIIYLICCGWSEVQSDNNNISINIICGLQYNKKTNILTVDSEKTIGCNEELSFRASISNQNQLIQCKAGSDEFWVNKIIIIFKNEENTVVYLNNNMAVAEKGEKQLVGEIITGDLREGTLKVEPHNRSAPCIVIPN